jgi:SEC-C motif-containing protein
VLAGAPAPTAEALMRSRYTAFVREDETHLLASWHPDTRPEQVEFEPGLRWLGLSVRGVHAGGETDELGTVEFVARCKLGGRARRIHELSRFVRHGGRWTYVDGLHGPEKERKGGRP